MKDDFLRDQKPKPTWQILNKFEEVRKATYEFFDDESPELYHDSILYEEEEEKLNAKMDEYEHKIYYTNWKNTKIFLS